MAKKAVKYEYLRRGTWEIYFWTPQKHMLLKANGNLPFPENSNFILGSLDDYADGFAVWLQEVELVAGTHVDKF